MFDGHLNTIDTLKEKEPRKWCNIVCVYLSTIIYENKILSKLLNYPYLTFF